MRLALFLGVGATVALANLVTVSFYTAQHRLPYAAYIALVTEGSILVSFTLNDRITFLTLANGGRPWYSRCLRFHGAAAFGAFLTIALSTIIHSLMHVPPVPAQCAAIAIATGVNFSSHRLWTYRGPRSARAVPAAPSVDHVSEKRFASATPD